MPAKDPSCPPLRRFCRDLGLAFLACFFTLLFLLQPYKVEGSSMLPALLDQERILVQTWLSTPETIRRGDIIVFKYPEAPERDFIKRVIGLPGEVIELRKKRVYIDDAVLDEPYVRFLVPPDEEGGADFDVRVQYGPVTVPAGHYFMMGDNRDNSQDSRYWGFLPEEYVKGRALFVYFSFGEESGLSGLVTGVRWKRILHQIR